MTGREIVEYQALQRFPNLRAVDLYNLEPGPELLAEILACPQIESLTLGLPRPPVTFEPPDLHPLVRLPMLRHLDVDNVTPAVDLSFLAGMTQLEEIWIFFAETGDGKTADAGDGSALLYLSELHRLRKVYLPWQKWHAKDLQRLISNSPVTELCVSEGIDGLGLTSAAGNREASAEAVRVSSQDARERNCWSVGAMPGDRRADRHGQRHAR